MHDTYIKDVIYFVDFSIDLKFRTPLSTTPPTPLTPQSAPPCDVTKQREPTKINESLLCAVCGDNAVCQHYGVRTCEGCKGFFKVCIYTYIHTYIYKYIYIYIYKDTCAIYIYSAL